MELSKGTKTLAELEYAIGKSKSWLSEIIKGLEERGFLRKEKGGRKIRLSNNYETRVLLSLLNEFSLQSLFCGKKEFILRSLPKSVAGLEKQFSKSMIYQSIKDFLKVTAREEIGRGGEEGIETAVSRF